jgi:hypothetical protein
VAHPRTFAPSRPGDVAKIFEQFLPLSCPRAVD